MNELIRFSLVAHVMSMLFLLNGCGLSYVPVETPEAFLFRRQEAIKNYCESTFNKTGAIYSPIQFGESELVKPADLRQLDSLYNVKYELEKRRKSDEKLEENIRFERARLQQAKISPIYLEEHLFSVKERDTITFYFCTFQLTKETQIEDVKIEQSIRISARDEDRYYRFLTEDALFYSADINEEKAFYMYFKDKADQLTGVELDQFIDHVMRLMESIEFMQSTDPKTIVEHMLSGTLKGKSYKQQATNFKWNLLPPKSWGSATNNGYIVTYTSQNQGSSPEETKGSVIEFTLNPYFMIDRKAITSME